MVRFPPPFSRAGLRPDRSQHCGDCRFYTLDELDHQSGLAPRELSPGEIERFWSPTTAIANVARVPIEYAEEFYWSILLATVAAMVAWSIAWGGAGWPPILPFGRAMSRFAASLNGGLAFLLIAFSLPGPIVGAMVLRFFQLPFLGLAWLNDHTLLAPVSVFNSVCFRWDSFPPPFWCGGEE